MKNIVKKIVLFIKDKNGSEDKGAGIAVAIIGKKVGETVSIDSPNGSYDIKIVSIK